LSFYGGVLLCFARLIPVLLTHVKCGLNKRIKEVGREGVVIYEKPAMPTNKKDSS
jgi:hypothetical protein